jgi:hypothetical protein
LSKKIYVDDAGDGVGHAFDEEGNAGNKIFQ